MISSIIQGTGIAATAATGADNANSADTADNADTSGTVGRIGTGSGISGNTSSLDMYGEKMSANTMLGITDIFPQSNHIF